MEAACITSTPYMSALLAIKLSQVLGIHCKISEVNRDATVDSDLGRWNSAILHVWLVNNPDIYYGARLLK
jgi:hypothetical protein